MVGPDVLASPQRCWEGEGRYVFELADGDGMTVEGGAIGMRKSCWEGFGSYL